MENNQEHNIDKIFKKSLGNQSVTPPADAWMGVHTYTIGQEKTERKIGFRYISWGVLILLIFSLGYYFNLNENSLNLDSSDSRINGLKATSPLQKSLPLSVSSQTTVQKLSVETQTTAVENIKQIPKSINLNSDSSDLRIDGLKDDIQIQKSINLINPNSDKNRKDEIYQPEELTAKSYTTVDLSKKMEEDLMNNIDEGYLREKLIQKDSVVEETRGKMFSLKHPIIIGLTQNYSF